MKNPFPGMNPYLEAVDWSGVHARLTVYMAGGPRPKLSRGADASGALAVRYEALA